MPETVGFLSVAGMKGAAYGRPLSCFRGLSIPKTLSVLMTRWNRLGVGRSVPVRASLEAENTILRHQLNVLRRMSPGFSAKNGVQYRFYVSSTLLRGARPTMGRSGVSPQP